MSLANQTNMLSYLGYQFRCSEMQHNSGLNKTDIYFFLNYLGISLELVGRLHRVRNPSILLPLSYFSSTLRAKLAHQHVHTLINTKGKSEEGAPLHFKGMISRAHDICSHPIAQNLVKWLFQLANKARKSSLFFLFVHLLS